MVVLVFVGHAKVQADFVQKVGFGQLKAFGLEESIGVRSQLILTAVNPTRSGVHALTTVTPDMIEGYALTTVTPDVIGGLCPKHRHPRHDRGSMPSAVMDTRSSRA